MAEIYKVQAGDTLYSLAKANGLSVDELKSRNNLTSNTISIGQELNFSAKNKTDATTSAIKADKKDTPATNGYKVQKGDTLYRIAKNNNCDVKALAILNGLDTENPTIKPGQTLNLPASKKSLPATSTKKETATTTNNTTTSKTEAKGPFKGTIMLDAGHGVVKKNGVIDNGASGADGKTTEYALNKEIAADLEKKLTEKGYKVIRTDSTKSNKARQNKKVAEKPDIFVSVHMNSAISPKATGEEVLHGTSKESKELATQINEGLKADDTIAQRKNPVVKRGGLTVLKEDKDIPSALVEVGFISNEQELKKIQENKGKISDSIMDGINKYFDSKKAK